MILIVLQITVLVLLWAHCSFELGRFLMTVVMVRSGYGDDAVVGRGYGTCLSNARCDANSEYERGRERMVLELMPGVMMLFADSASMLVVLVCEERR